MENKTTNELIELLAQVADELESRQDKAESQAGQRDEQCGGWTYTYDKESRDRYQLKADSLQRAAEHLDEAISHLDRMMKKLYGEEATR